MDLAAAETIVAILIHVRLVEVCVAVSTKSSLLVGKHTRPSSSDSLVLCRQLDGVLAKLLCVWSGSSLVIDFSSQREIVMAMDSKVGL